MTDINLEIGGFVPFSTVDFPNHLAAVIFCQGCPFRCHYCHNTHLIPRKHSLYKWDDIFTYLTDRTNLLEAVVFSGGEPTLQNHLLYAISATKQLGFKIGLHTAGAYPQKLKELLPLLDWVGLDIKAPFNEYETITTIPKSGERVLASLKLLLDSGVSYELRTTVHPKLLNTSQLLKIAKSLRQLNATNHKLQKFRAEGCTNKDLIEYAY